MALSDPGRTIGPVADAPIPGELLQLQQAFDQAHAALVGAASVTDNERETLRAAERNAALALHRYRQDHPEWAPWPQQQRVQEAARSAPVEV